MDGDGTPQGQHAVIVHSLAQAMAPAEAAVALGISVTIESAHGAGGNAGVGWFVALTAAVQEAYPDHAFRFLLDCAAEPGTVFAALRRGVKQIRFTGPPEVAAKLMDIAASYGATIERETSSARDLLAVKDPASVCRVWFSGVGAPDCIAQRAGLGRRP
jgi:hypothetical protein